MYDVSRVQVEEGVGQVGHHVGGHVLLKLNALCDGVKQVTSLKDTWYGVRDWSSITGRGGGGLQNGRGKVKFYPYKKGGRKKF